MLQNYKMMRYKNHFFKKRKEKEKIILFKVKLRKYDNAFAYFDFL